MIQRMGPNPGRLVGALAVVCALAVSPAVASAAKKKPGPPMADLVISKVTVHGLANGPFAVVDPSGSASPLTVHVILTNAGTKGAGRSRIHVFISNLSSRFNAYASAGALKPRESEPVNVDISGWRPTLGFSFDFATADIRHKVPESDENNNTTDGPKIAVEARQWTVNQFSTKRSSPLASGTTSSQPGFVFRLRKYDTSSELFRYEAFGKLMDAESEQGVCSYNGSKTVTNSPWTGSSYLDVSGTLKSYDGYVQGSTVPSYTAPVSCFGISAPPATLKFQDLVTFDGSKGAVKIPAPFEPAIKRMSGSFTDTQGVQAYTWNWTFQADVP
jgi:hypothetical protein